MFLSHFLGNKVHCVADQLYLLLGGSVTVACQKFLGLDI